MRVTLLTNGPGELWGWARPVVMELRRRGCSVSLWLLPCPFASGHERQAASLLGVDKLEGPASSASSWRAMARERTDHVVQLGGDLMFGRRIARASKAPLLCYTYGPKKGLEGATVLTAFPQQAMTIGGARAIGDLVKDSLLMDARDPWDWPEDAASARVLFLPGSRPAIRRVALPWLSSVASLLRAEMPSVRVRALFPPFVPEGELRAWREAGLEPVRAGAGAAMRGADFALAQPGTNNFELLHCGLPSLVVAPATFLEVIPVAGMMGALASLPVVGRALRRKAVLRILDRWGGKIAPPNRLAARNVMDEMYGDIGPQDVASRILQWLADSEGRAEMRARLLAMSGEAGAAARLCDALSIASGAA